MALQFHDADDLVAAISNALNHALNPDIDNPINGFFLIVLPVGADEAMARFRTNIQNQALAAHVLRQLAAAIDVAPAAGVRLQ